MNADFANFTEPQRRALLDLLSLARYLDGHLDAIEDARLEIVLIALGYDTEYDRQRELDAAVTRVRPYTQPPTLARTHAIELAKHFTEREQQRKVYAALESIVTSDAHITTGESQLLEELRSRFRL